jgi:hypothetical protein
LAEQAGQGIHPAGNNDHYEPKSGGVSAISPGVGTAAVDRENSQKNKRAKAVRTFAPLAEATFVAAALSPRRLPP